MSQPAISSGVASRPMPSGFGAEGGDALAAGSGGLGAAARVAASAAEPAIAAAGGSRKAC